MQFLYLIMVLTATAITGYPGRCRLAMWWRSHAHGYKLRKTVLCVKGKFYFSHSWKRCSLEVFPVTLLACSFNVS